MHAVLLNVSLFFMQSTALLALLPLAARGLQGGGAGTFTVLLASMGGGAVHGRAVPAAHAPDACRATGWCATPPCCTPPPPWG